jgi:hypothetical protein
MAMDELLGKVDEPTARRRELTADGVGLTRPWPRSRGEPVPARPRAPSLTATPSCSTPPLPRDCVAGGPGSRSPGLASGHGDYSKSGVSAIDAT